MRRIFAVMCVRNEAHRYLQASLAWNAGCWDELFVFDDQSDDKTPKIASRFGHVLVRADDEPSFLEHEGRFRAAGWAHFGRVMLPSEGDWIISLDADEFLLSNGRRGLADLAERAEANGRRSAAIHVPEAWDNGEGIQIRVDGYWNQNWNPRFCSWNSEFQFNDRPMGCGSTPSYAWANPLKVESGVEIMHVGYLDRDERFQRYERYTSHPEGHNPNHINSIIESPLLEAWSGTTPVVWRGER